MRNSGRYPLCGRGDINVYAVFAEGMRTLLNDRGRVGCVLPTGIATDDTTKFFFQDRDREEVARQPVRLRESRSCLPCGSQSHEVLPLHLAAWPAPTAEAAEFVFFAHAVEDLRDPERRFTLTAEDIELLNPNTRTCPSSARVATPS